MCYCEQDDIAADFLDLMTTPCTIQRKNAGVQDEFGASVAATSTSFTTVCRVTTLRSPRESVQGGQVTSQSRRQIILPLSTPLSEKDAILVAGAKFTVTALDREKTDAFFLTADVAKAQ